MADNSQKTEQPTQRRQEKAREQGQFLSARQFLSGVQFCVFVLLIQNHGGKWMDGMTLSVRALMRRAFQGELDVAELARLAMDIAWTCLEPLGVAGAILVAVTFALQLAFTRMGFALKKLVPDFGRLNPASHLSQMFQQNIPSLLQAVILLPLSAGAVYAIAYDQLEAFLLLPLLRVTDGVRQVGDIMLSLLWKGAALFFVFGCVDLFRQMGRHQKELRMSKQEIKDEAKESEGDPHIKAKVRSLRRSMAQRRMMQAVPQATAVVVNPTHFAVALRYFPESMAAPVVVAKGKNYLALRIKQKAIDHSVPLIENPPLAQALYKSVDVGQEIPPHLYRVVAEVLAYIFRVMNRR